MSARIAAAIAPGLRIEIPTSTYDQAQLSQMSMRELQRLGESDQALRPIIEGIHLQRRHRYFIILGLSSAFVAGLSAGTASRYSQSLAAILGTGLFIGLCVMGLGLAGYVFCVPKPHWQTAATIAPPPSSLAARLITSAPSVITSRTPHV